MRLLLSRVFKALRSNLISFMAGSVFSVFINLATAKVDLRKSVALPLGLLALATLGLIALVLVLDHLTESASKKPNPLMEYSANLYNNALTLGALFGLSLLVLLAALWLLSH